MTILTSGRRPPTAADLGKAAAEPLLDEGITIAEAGEETRIGEKGEADAVDVVETVANVENVEIVEIVETVANVENVENVEIVETVANVEIVETVANVAAVGKKEVASNKKVGVAAAAEAKEAEGEEAAEKTGKEVEMDAAEEANAKMGDVNEVPIRRRVAKKVSLVDAEAVEVVASKTAIDGERTKDVKTAGANRFSKAMGRAVVRLLAPAIETSVSGATALTTTAPLRLRPRARAAIANKTSNHLNSNPCRREWRPCLSTTAANNAVITNVSSNNINVSKTASTIPNVSNSHNQATTSMIISVPTSHNSTTKTASNDNGRRPLNNQRGVRASTAWPSTGRTTNTAQFG